MSVLLLWVVSPAEISGGLGFSETTRERGKFADNSRSLSGEGGTSSRRSWKLRGRKPKWISCSLNTSMKYGCLGFEPENSRNFPLFSSLVAKPAGEIGLTLEQKVYDVVLKQAALVKKLPRSKRVMDVKPDVAVPGAPNLLNEAYDRCGEVCKEYAKTFYLGTMLMTPERRRAIWAIYVWCRRTDELVDGPDASHITPTVDQGKPGRPRRMISWMSLWITASSMGP